MEVKIQYGLHKETGLIKHISEVDKGEKSGCYCIDCDGILIARKGKKQTHHFQHKSMVSCSGGSPETVLHALGKQIINENKRILLSNKTYFDYSETILEKRIVDFQPDAIVKNSQNKQWLIEIAVTHYVDDEKKEKIIRENENCIEIALKPELINGEQTIIINEVLNNPRNRKIINDVENIIERKHPQRKKNNNNLGLIALGLFTLYHRKKIQSFFRRLFS